MMVASLAPPPTFFAFGAMSGSFDDGGGTLYIAQISPFGNPSLSPATKTTGEAAVVVVSSPESDPNSSASSIMVSFSGYLSSASAQSPPSAAGNSETSSSSSPSYIHSGTSCESVEAQGNPMYQLSHDRTNYTLGEIEGTIFGDDMDDISAVDGRAFVVYNSNSERSGCGILKEAGTKSMLEDGGFKKYQAETEPLTDLGTTSKLTVYANDMSGIVHVRGKAINLETNLQNAMYPNEGNNCTAKNGCGAHIHGGYSCESKMTQGGHYFEKDSDPWKHVGYSSTDASGTATFLHTVHIASSNITNRVFHIHADDGSRISCGPLLPAEKAKDFDPVESAAHTLNSCCFVSAFFVTFIVSNLLF